MDILDLGTDNVIAVRIDGKIETEDMKRLVTLVEERLQHHDKLRVYAEVIDLGGITWDALVADLKMGWHNWRVFERKAVVSDKSWIGKITPFFDKLFPSIELKHFAPDEKQQALDWITS